MDERPNASIVARAAVVAVVLVTAVVLGTSLGSARGPYDGWGCPLERIAHSVYEPAEGGGYDSPEDALQAHARSLAADGGHPEVEYANAVKLRTGPNRFDPDTGTLHIDDRIEARITLAQLADGTWTIDNELLCMRPVPAELASPNATPSASP